MSRLIDVALDDGRVHDLQELFHETNDRFFDGRVRATVCWGATRRPREKKSVTYAMHYLHRRLILVNRALDAAWVPRYVMAFLMFHELLHAVCRPIVVNGRQVDHHADFLAREATHPNCARFRAWEQRNLDRLLRS